MLRACIVPHNRPFLREYLRTNVPGHMLGESTLDQMSSKCFQSHLVQVAPSPLPSPSVWRLLAAQVELDMAFSAGHLFKLSSAEMLQERVGPLVLLV